MERCSAHGASFCFIPFDYPFVDTKICTEARKGKNHLKKLEYISTRHRYSFPVISKLLKGTTVQFHCNLIEYVQILISKPLSGRFLFFCNFSERNCWFGRFLSSIFEAPRYCEANSSHFVAVTMEDCLPDICFHVWISEKSTKKTFSRIWSQQTAERK